MSDALPAETVAAMKAKVPEVAELLRQLSNPTRLLLLCEIAQRECSVADLERDLGMKQPGLSQQLAELRQSKLVKTRRESRSIHYSIADQRAKALLVALHSIFCDSPDAIIARICAPVASVRRGDVAGFARITPR